MLLQKVLVALLTVASFLTIIQRFGPRAGLFSPVVPIAPKMLNGKCMQRWDGSSSLIPII